MAKAPKEKQDYAQTVATRLIEQLEAGTAPWQRPWKPGERFAPFNPTTGKDYRGMNTVWLMMQGRSDPRWMTYRQAEGEGAQVRKGESGTLIQYWKVEDRQKMLDAAGNPVLDSEGKPVMRTVRLERPRVMGAIVFNAEQIDGLPELVQRPALPEFERHSRAEAMLGASPVEIRHVPGDDAYYLPSMDKITLPERGQFVSADAYYATALHEIGHSTGHSSRLDRDLGHPFGSEGYAREELRAEIASLMLGEELGIGHSPDNHASYVKSWIRVLQDDPREIFRAAADAEKIRVFMLDLERQHEKAQEIYADEQRAEIALNLANPSMADSLEALAIEQGDATSDRVSAQLLSADQIQRAIDTIAPPAQGLHRLWGIASGDDNTPSSWRHSNVADLAADAEVADARLVYVDVGPDEWDRIVAGTEQMTRPLQQIREAGTRAADQLGRMSMSAELLEAMLGPWKGLDGNALSVRDMLIDVAGVWDRSAEIPVEAATYIASESIDRFSRRPAAVELFTTLASRHTAALGPVVQFLNEHSPGWHNVNQERQAKVQGGPSMTKLATERVTLNVPFAEKDHAKAAGARWDKVEKVWYAPKGADLEKLGRWQGEAPALRFEIPEVEFKAALIAAGLVIPDKELPKMDGQIHRVPVVGDKKGERSGAYCGYTNEHPAGFIQNYYRGTRENWKSERPTQSLSPQERARMMQESEERRAERAAAQLANYEKTAAAIEERLAQMPPASQQHPYLVAKGVLPLGLRQFDGGPIRVPPDDPQPMPFGRKGDLVVPYCDADGKVWGAQCIGSDGRKSLPKGSRLSGCFHMIGDPNGARSVAIAEGFSTAATIHQATGLPVAVAFNANNLRPVAEAIKAHYPELTQFIAGDNDHRRERDGRANVGRDKAEEAAQAVGGVAVLPRFEENDKGSDWNDFAKLHGDREIAAEFRRAHALAQRKETVLEIERGERELPGKQLGATLDVAPFDREPDRRRENTLGR